MRRSHLVLPLAEQHHDLSFTAGEQGEAGVIPVFSNRFAVTLQGRGVVQQLLQFPLHAMETVPFTYQQLRTPESDIEPYDQTERGDAAGFGSR